MASFFPPAWCIKSFKYWWRTRFLINWYCGLAEQVDTHTQFNLDDHFCTNAKKVFLFLSLCQCLSALRETWNAFLLYPDFFFLQVIEYEVFLPVWLVVCMSNKVINNVSYLEVNLRLFSIVGWWLKVMASMSPGLKWTSTSPLLGSSSNLARKRTSLLMVWIRPLFGKKEKVQQMLVMGKLLTDWWLLPPYRERAAEESLRRLQRQFEHKTCVQPQTSESVVKLKSAAGSFTSPLCSFNWSWNEISQKWSRIKVNLKTFGNLKTTLKKFHVFQKVYPILEKIYSHSKRQ